MCAVTERCAAGSSGGTSAATRHAAATVKAADLTRDTGFGLPPSAHNYRMVTDTVARPSPLRVGTVVWLASELMFFAGLFAAYYSIRSVAPVWPPADLDVDAVRAGLFTLVLVASSGTAQQAVRAAEHGDPAGVRRWFLVTVVLGAVFLGNQGLEWAGTGFAIDSHAYGSMYYLMTGVHGLHVLGGLVAMLVLVLRTLRDRFDASQESAVVVTGFYWHFVDVVWIGLYATLFLVR